MLKGNIVILERKSSKGSRTSSPLWGRLWPRRQPGTTWIREETARKKDIEKGLKEKKAHDREKEVNTQKDEAADGKKNTQKNETTKEVEADVWKEEADT